MLARVIDPDGPRADSAPIRLEGGRQPAATAVFVPTGPGVEHRRGLWDILEALAVYEPETREVLVICDGPLGPISQLPASSTIPVEIIPHPRAGRGNPLYGGDCAVTIEALRVLALDLPDLVVRLDTDALVIGRCFGRLAEFLGAHPSVGIVGAYRKGDQVVGVARAAKRLTHPIALYRDPPAGHPHLLQLALGSNSRVRTWLRRAEKAGWEAGTHCQGGSLAVSPRLLAALQDAGLLDRPSDWLSVPLPGDVMLAALAVALGFELADLSQAGEPFAVEYGRLPDCPAELVASGRCLIHSLKGDPVGRSEAELRIFFAEGRSRQR